jgi:predicted NAD-dependent protein-ADP-ribosyltransferase YbiA (DUF1768 family)
MLQVALCTLISDDLLQAHKFVGVNDPLARECVEKIKSAKSPEEAARMGRTMEKKRPDLVWLMH